MGKSKKRNKRVAKVKEQVETKVMKEKISEKVKRQENCDVEVDEEKKKKFTVKFKDEST